MVLAVAIPTEVKVMEGRVALVPDAVAELVSRGIPVFVQAGAGLHSGFQDSEFVSAGATVMPDAASTYAAGQLVVKVKEPQTVDLSHLRSHHLLFCYLHLAPNPALASALAAIGLTAIAFETVESGGRLPLLAPMSEIAGRVAVQAGAHYLHGSMGGAGVLLGGVPGTRKGRVVVLGAGIAGRNAALAAAAMGAEVIVFDRHPDALRAAEALDSRISGVYMSLASLEAVLPGTDLLIGAVLIPGKTAPRLVTRTMVKMMRPGSVIVDISIDQGGCVETMRVTDYKSPTFVEEGVVHMGVANLPGGVPRTSSYALAGAILPYVADLALAGGAVPAALHHAVNVADGRIVHPALLQN